MCDGGSLKKNMTQLVTASELATHLKRGMPNVYQWVKRGLITSVDPSARPKLYDLEASVAALAPHLRAFKKDASENLDGAVTEPIDPAPAPAQRKKTKEKSPKQIECVASDALNEIHRKATIAMSLAGVDKYLEFIDEAKENGHFEVACYALERVITIQGEALELLGAE